MLSALAFSALGQTNLAGSGTTNPSRYFWEAADILEARNINPTHITYRAVGSSTGQKEFLGDPEDAFDPATSTANFTALNDFGAGDIPMSSARYASLISTGRNMVHVPFALGAIGVFHSVPTSALGTHGKLSLNACDLAGIFTGKITSWGHPAIKAKNPGMSASAPIMVAHRVKGSSSTAGFTEYLKAKCPAVWTGAAGATVEWAVGTGAQGSGGMSGYIADNAYAIGYVDAGHGHGEGLSEVALQNKEGVYLTTLEADIGAAATAALAQGDVIPTDPTADFSAVNLYDMPGNSTWPITMISYFYLEKDLSYKDADVVSLMMAFVNFVLSAEGQEIAVENKFSILPPSLVAYNDATLASIVTPAGMVSYAFESASSTKIINGQLDHVISGKRQSFADYERKKMKEDIEAMQAKIVQLSSMVTALGGCSDAEWKAAAEAAGWRPPCAKAARRLLEDDQTTRFTAGDDDDDDDGHTLTQKPSLRRLTSTVSALAK
uniref:PBP domain-containing protein n=1 Tax=Calcidiscus leptoporus TaxID=127549 RepID=A0A7S0NSE7_9EUKA|mmetsp:Transcript_18398/g.42180  ORF Transcript_18398/g.42180 Transcript_18398/m.42180 type:complete len:493 (+) Transcript_18398:50-1528(+)